MDGNNIKNANTRKYISGLAEHLIGSIKEKTNRNISIAISDFCDTLSRFPRAYAECQETFRENFRLGEGSYAFYGEKDKVKSSLRDDDIDLFVSQIVFYLIAMDEPGYKKSIEDMISYLHGTDTSSVDIRLHMVKLVNHLSDYYLEFGLEKKNIDLLNHTAMKDILNSNYLSSIEKILKLFCGEILKQVIIIHQSSEEKIRIFCNELLKKFYNDSDFNLAKAAGICHYSSYHFGRLFKQIFGVSFNQYLTNFRIEKSKELLKQSQLSVEDIAWKVGFSSVSYYCTVFKKITGVSPRRYLKKENEM